MFTVEGIGVLGAPVVLSTDADIKNCVAENCSKIMVDIGKHEPLTDGFAHFQQLKFCQNTRTQYMSANVNIHHRTIFSLCSINTLTGHSQTLS